MSESANVCIPNSFQTPNIVVDRLMELLDSDEYKAVSFVIRHILGWRSKIASRKGCISYTMFLDGFTDDNGTHYGGTGLGRTKLNRVLKNMTNFRVLVKVGTAAKDGQEWKLPFDDPDSIDWEGLEKRKTDAEARAQKRTKKATEAKAEQRRNTNDESATSTSDVPQLNDGDRYVARTATSTSHVPQGSTSHVHNKTHIDQTHDQTQIESPDGDSGRDPESIEPPIQSPLPMPIEESPDVPAIEPEPAIDPALIDGRGDLTPFKAAQTVVIDHWFAGDWANAGWAGKLTHMFMGTSEDKGYQEYNFQPAFDANHLEKWVEWMKQQEIELPTSPPKLVRWKSKYLQEHPIREAQESAPGESRDPLFNPIFANMTLAEQFEYNRRASVEACELALGVTDG